MPHLSTAWLICTSQHQAKTANDANHQYNVRTAAVVASSILYTQRPGRSTDPLQRGPC